MAVTVNSQLIINATAQPVVFNNAYLAGANDYISTAVCAAGASDGNGSIYRFCRIPSNAMVLGTSIMNDANTSGTSYKLGVLATAGNGGAVIVAGSDAIFVPAGTSMASARSIFTALYFPAIVGASAAVANVTLRVWELLGLTSDPNAVYDVALTAVTAGSAGGNMALRLSYTQ